MSADFWWGFAIGGTIVGAIAATLAALVVGMIAGSGRHEVPYDAEVRW